MPPAPKLMTRQIKDVTLVTFADAHIRDLPQIEQIGEQLYGLVGNRDLPRFVIDFEKVQTLSSQALGILLTVDKKITGTKGRLVLCNVRPEIHRLFEIARLHKHFKFVATREAALALLGVAEE